MDSDCEPKLAVKNIAHFKTCWNNSSIVICAARK